MARGRKLTTEEFIKRSTEKHSGKYDYSLANYTGSNGLVRIICPTHGEFSQRAAGHLAGNGCMACKNGENSERLKKTTEEFIKQAKEIHGNKYDYSLSKYTGSNNKIEIVCPAHGPFFQRAGTHLKGSGCRKCADDDHTIRMTMSTAGFIMKAKNIHGETYDYNAVRYKSSREEVDIMCPTHGVFKQTPETHLKGSGCQECAKLITRLTHTDTGYNKWVKNCEAKYGDKYDYSKVNYEDCRKRVDIICTEHNTVFSQTPESHLLREGCPKCRYGGKSSKEEELADFLSRHIDIKRNVRGVIGRHELDILIPDKNMAIEFNGNFWHSERFKNKNHLIEKQKLCASHSIRLIHVAEYEDQEVVKKTLLHILGVTKNRVYARNCECREIECIGTKELLEENHLQGWVSGCKSFGIFHNNDLIGCMLFSSPVGHRGLRKEEGVWELRRFSTKTAVIGGAGKLFASFIRKYQPKTITSYSDNRWFTGEMYRNLGFTKDKYLRPDYKYMKSELVVPKNMLTKSRMKKLPGFDFSPEETEHDNALRNGYLRIWDCGKTKWVWKNPGQ